MNEEQFRQAVDAFIKDIDDNLETPASDRDQYTKLYHQQVFFNKEHVPVMFMEVHLDCNNMIKVAVRPIGPAVTRNPLQINQLVKDGEYYSLTQSSITQSEGE